MNTWMLKQKEIMPRRLSHLLIPPRYHISDIDLCRIQNWIITHIEGARQMDSWMRQNRLPVYHACTILLAFRLWASNLKVETDSSIQWDSLLNEAWKYQSTPPAQSDQTSMGGGMVDIDLEVIRDLEFSMFEDGIGEDWGLDTDSHQSNWDPYATYTHGFGPRTNAPPTENKIDQEMIGQTEIAPSQKKVWVMTSLICK